MDVLCGGFASWIVNYGHCVDWSTWHSLRHTDGVWIDPEFTQGT